MSNQKMQRIETGAKNLLGYMRVRKERNDRLVILTDRQTEGLAATIRRVAEPLCDSVHFIIMEDHGERPFKSGYPESLKEAVAEAKPTVTLYAAGIQDGELEFRKGVITHVLGLGARHAHAPLLTEEVMLTGLQLDPESAGELTAKVIGAVRSSREITVTSAAGTALSFQLNPDNLKWIASTGFIEDGEFSNPLGAEVFTCPAGVSGVLVVDGVIGDKFSAKYGLIGSTPVRIEIKEGRATTFDCPGNRVLERELREYLQGAENGLRVGELGIGTNTGLTALTGNLLLDEKRAGGIHVAFGHPIPEETGADWKASVHVDCITLNTTMVVDASNVVMRDGIFVL